MPKVVLESMALGFQWPTIDPFLFCVHHNDAYPQGDGRFGPAASLDGRQIGQDFEGKDGWRMYHGEHVPGFPPHPHRGFETVTIARKGYIDHSDSLGATARFGGGDTQWLTAGAGIVHSEMFPLLQTATANPAELFQIWLNLPKANKMAPPHFTMFWDEKIPRVTRVDEAGKRTDLAIIAGAYEGTGALPPPPHSYASLASSDIAIWTLRMDPGARITLPPAASHHTVRMIYFFEGPRLQVAEETFDAHRAVLVRSDAELPLQAGDGEVEVLVLQGKPLGEPVAHYGPFVMNSREELQQAFADYQRTQFGGWPFQTNEPVHGNEGRFAKHPDGRVEHIAAIPVNKG